MLSTHFKNISNCDIDQFCRAQEATTNVYKRERYTEEERHSDMQNWLCPEGLRIFSTLAALLLVEVMQDYNLLVVPGEEWKISRNADRIYF